MSRRWVYRDETLAIIGRFFEALDALIETKAIRGLNTYCTKYNIDSRHIYAQKKDLNKGFFEVYWILPMISDYGVSSKWMLFGKGPMFRPTAKRDTGTGDAK